MPTAPNNPSLTLLASTLVSLTISTPSTAQIIPDATAGSLTSTTGNNTTISGGTRSGNALFHSFDQFSIPANTTAQFTNASDLTTVVTRVTGLTPSLIDGTLATAGTADFFLINPNGIVFGSTAQLNVGGSFIASTANSVVLGNGLDFSAVNPESASLLTVSTPIGLQYGAAAPADIEVLGTGHGFIIDPDTLAVTPTTPRIGLQVPDGATLALLGGFVTLDGGNLTAPDGQVILGGVAEDSQIPLTTDAQGWNADLTNVQSLADVGLFNASSVVTSGNGSGAVQISGQFINVLDGSTILANTLGTDTGQTTTLQASEEIVLSGALFDQGTGEAIFPSSILSEVDIFASGNGGSVVLNTPYLFVGEGAQVSSNTFDVGDGGDITITANLVELVGGTPELGSSGFFLQVGDAFSLGEGGDLTLQAETLRMLDGAVIDGSSFGPGDAGQINITAEQFLEVVGGLPALGPSRIVSQTEDQGIGGGLALNTDRLLIGGGGRVETTTFGPSDAGDIDITANQIALIGGAVDFGPSGLLSQTEGSGQGGDINIVSSDRLGIFDGAALLSETFGDGNGGTINVLADEILVEGTSPGGRDSNISSVSDVGSTGEAGAIEISTPQLTVTAGGEIRSSTRGFGRAGKLDIQAQSVDLVGAPDLSTGLFSTVEAGATGAVRELSLQTNRLSLTEGAQVVTGTLGPGAAGDLQVSADTILLDGRNRNGASSGLFASALVDTGAGGSITVNAEDLLIQDGATINASNFPSFDDAILPGQGAAGNLNITAGSIQLRNQGSVTASTLTGDQGNIRLESDIVLLRNNSEISTNASQTATGGNVVIVSDFLTAVPTENSDITANAEQGQGGRIEITTQAILGFAFPARLTDNSDITASSDVGLNGEVIVNRLTDDPANDLVALPESLLDKSDQIVAGCPANQGATFVATGRGGISENFAQQVQAPLVIPSFERSRAVSRAMPLANHTQYYVAATPLLETATETPMEASGWGVDEQGKTVLMAHTTISHSRKTTCFGEAAT